MPVVLSRNKASGAIYMRHSCEVCGSANAPFGDGVHTREAFKAIEAGDRATGFRMLGRWYCFDHWPDKPQPQVDQKELF